RRPFPSPIPAIVAHRHIDAMLAQELRRFIVPPDGALMQNAGRLVRAPVRVDICSALQQERSNLKLLVRACPGQRYVQDLLRVGGSPMQVPQDVRIVGGVMLAEAPQPRTTGLIKPTSDSCEVPYAG